MKKKTENADEMMMKLIIQKVSKNDFKELLEEEEKEKMYDQDDLNISFAYGIMAGALIMLVIKIFLELIFI